MFDAHRSTVSGLQEEIQRHLAASASDVERRGKLIRRRLMSGSQFALLGPNRGQLFFVVGPGLFRLRLRGLQFLMGLPALARQGCHGLFQFADLAAQSSDGLFVPLERLAQFTRRRLARGKRIRMFGAQRGNVLVVLRPGLIEQGHRGFQVLLKCAAFRGQRAQRILRGIDLTAQSRDDLPVIPDRFRQVAGSRLMCREFPRVSGIQIGDLLLVFRFRTVEFGRGFLDLFLKPAAFVRPRIERALQAANLVAQFGGAGFVPAQYPGKFIRRRAMRREQTGVFRMHTGQFQFVLGVNSIEIRRGRFETLLELCPFAGHGIQRVLQSADFSAQSVERLFARRQVFRKLPRCREVLGEKARMFPAHGGQLRFMFGLNSPVIRRGGFEVLLKLCPFAGHGVQCALQSADFLTETRERLFVRIEIFREVAGRRLMRREQAGLLGTHGGEFAHPFGLGALEIRRGGFELFLEFGAFAGDRVEGLLQIRGLAAQGGERGFVGLSDLRGLFALPFCRGPGLFEFSA